MPFRPVFSRGPFSRGFRAPFAAASPAFQQIADLAENDGWTHDYLSAASNPDLRTLREDGGSFFYTHIKDALGNGPDLVQETAAAQFTFVEGAFDQLDAARGPDAESAFRMVSDALSEALTQPLTFVAVGNLESTNSRGFLHDGLSNNEGKTGLLGADSFAAIAGATLNFDGPGTSTAIFTTHFAGASSRVRIDGVQDATGDAGTSNVTGFTFGQAGSVTSRSWHGDLTPFLVIEGSWASVSSKVAAMEDLIGDLIGVETGS